jgi:hypothetical protein
MTRRFDIPLTPPLRGQQISPHVDVRAKNDSECTVMDQCDQCGRRVGRPHVVIGRPYCPRCCPACSQINLNRPSRQRFSAPIERGA